jgi:hypothetical protein
MIYVSSVVKVLRARQRYFFILYRTVPVRFPAVCALWNTSHKDCIVHRQIPDLLEGILYYTFIISPTAFLVYSKIYFMN